MKLSTSKCGEPGGIQGGYGMSVYVDDGTLSAAGERLRGERAAMMAIAEGWP